MEGIIFLYMIYKSMKKFEVIIAIPIQPYYVQYSFYLKKIPEQSPHTNLLPLC